MSDWTLRPAVPNDEAVIASMWLHALCNGQDARSLGLKDATSRGSDTQVQFWAIHQPIVTALIRGADVVVACDPERSAYEPGEPAVVWVWAVTSGDAVYGVGIKRSASRAGVGADIARDLLGDRLLRKQRTVMDLVDLAALRMIPDAWVRERGWISSLRYLSAFVASGDVMCRDVAAYLVDPTRERWVPSSRRAA